jgi:hypothetical protein
MRFWIQTVLTLATAVWMHSAFAFYLPPVPAQDESAKLAKSTSSFTAIQTENCLIHIGETGSTQWKAVSGGTDKTAQIILVQFHNDPHCQLFFGRQLNMEKSEQPAFALLTNHPTKDTNPIMVIHLSDLGPTWQPQMQSLATMMVQSKDVTVPTLTVELTSSH